MAANRERGELLLRLGGREHILRPTFEAIEAMEVETGLSLIELARGAAAGALPLKALGIIVAEGVKAHGRAVKSRNLSGVAADTMARAIYAERGGVAFVNAHLRLMLALAVSGGYSAQGEPKPGEPKPGEAEGGAEA